jgi:hypothetical protein
VSEPGVLALLRRHQIDLLLAVRPHEVGALPRVVAACRDHGVGVAAWPMLDDADGRWASVRNVEAFSSFVRRMIDAVPMTEVAIDLEPPIDDVRAMLAGPRGAGRALRKSPSRESFARAREQYGALVDELHARDVRVTAAALPVVLLDPHGRRARWQRLAGTPVEGPAFDHVSVMLYTTMIEGWSRGLLERAHARAVLAGACLAVARRFGDAGGVSLGAVGVGALGDEPIYRDVSELADDVAIAQRAGCHDLTLFDLGGVLSRAPVDAWLDAFVHTPAAASLPPESRRARLLRASVPLLRFRALRD